MSTATIASARAAHSCPAWCTVDPSVHEADLTGWEGHRIHDSGALWERAHGRLLAVSVSCSTSPMGELDGRESPDAWEAPKVWLDDVDELTADEAREMAWALIHAAAKIDALMA